MPDKLRSRAETLSRRYAQRSGKLLHITSGQRSPAKQAAAMYGLIVRRKAAYVRNLYKNKAAFAQIFDAYQRNINNSAAAINAMTRTIENQVKNGVFISRHLQSRALDVSTTTDLRILRDEVAAMGGTVVNEKDHYHIQF